MLSLCAACATQSGEERAHHLVNRYGPQCGINSASHLLALPELEQQRAAACIKSEERTDKDRSLERGLRALQSSQPPRVDGRCLTDCVLRYTHAYCQKRCSY